MTFLKTIMVMLFSLVLIGSQAVFSSTFAPSGNSAQAQACQCCDCDGSVCCVQESSTPSSEPLASVPLNSAGQSQQWVAAICRLLLQTPPIDDVRVVLVSLTLPAASAVPLFKQNCIFLI